MRIVVAEDNESLASAISRALGYEGHSVELFHDGIDADEHLAGTGADLSILDINLPRLDGLTVLGNIRRRNQTMPVLILTARSGGTDRVAGLDAGADDYLVKPFLMEELLARIRALARRRRQFSPVIERVGVVEYNRGTRIVRIAGTAIDLPPRERALFDLLFDQIGVVVSKSSIAASLYGHGADVDPNAVELAISRLRRRLGDAAPIRTVRGLGYLLDPGTDT